MEKHKDTLSEHQINIMNKLETLHKKWVEHVKDMLVSLPNGEEKIALTNWVNEIEDRRNIM